MKEKDIVDFEKLEKDEEGNPIDENGNDIGCEVCYTHKKAYEKFYEIIADKDITDPFTSRVLCPNCGELLVKDFMYTDSEDMGVVSEGNFSKPDGNIGYYPILKCKNPKCKDKYENTPLFALIPEPITYNGNHDIMYTGGDYYLMDKDMIKLSHELFESMKPSIDQYVDRKLNAKNAVDSGLNEWNLHTWTSRDVEHKLAEWFYNHGMKK